MSECGDSVENPNEGRTRARRQVASCLALTQSGCQQCEAWCFSLRLDLRSNRHHVRCLIRRVIPIDTFQVVQVIRCDAKRTPETGGGSVPQPIHACEDCAVPELTARDS